MIGTALAVFEVIQTIIKLAPQAIQTYEDAKKFIVPLWGNLTNGSKPTDTEIDQIEAEIDALHLELQAPLPDGD